MVTTALPADYKNDSAGFGHRLAEAMMAFDADYSVAIFNLFVYKKRWSILVTPFFSFLIRSASQKNRAKRCFFEI